MSTENTWPLVRLKDVTVDVQNLDPSRSPETLFTYVDISSIDNERCQIVSPKRVLGKNAPSRARRPLADEDVLFSNVRTYLRNVGQVRDLAGPALASTGFTLLRPKDELSSRFLYHLVRSDIFIEKVTPEQTGTHYPATSDRVVRDQLIPLPPMPVQERLACLIDAMETSRSSATDHLEKARNAIDRFRQAVLAAACSGRLTADWRGQNPEVESADALIARSRATLAKRARARRIPEEDAAPDWLEIPETWKWAPLASLAEIRGGIQKQPKRAPKKNAYPYLRVANVLRGRLDLSEIHHFELFNDELETYRLVPDDLLIVEGNGSLSEIGRSAIWNGSIDDCVHQNHIIRVRCIEAEPRFIDLVWNSPVGAREIADLAVTSAGLYSLSAGKIAAFAIPVPPLEEQREIVRRANALLRLAEAQLARIDAAARRVDRSSQAVLAKAFRGELIGGLA